MQPAKRLTYTPDPNQFDLRTHIWDAQGALVGKNLYRKFIVGDRTYYERPVNSGNLWFENNEPAGRVECEFNDKGHIVRKEFLVGEKAAPHKVFTAPLTGDAKAHFELEQIRAKNAALEAELSQIKKEREAIEVKAIPTAKAAPAAIGLGSLNKPKEG